ncbi:MAG: T9SS type A sorting domain-containing protein [Bacteroidales bacterium]|nr:T9SS type A sorting domain-containing protein [Bacteroidales bacterium]
MKSIILITLVLAFSSLFAQTNYISFSGHSTKVELREPLRSLKDNGVDGLQVSYHFDAMNAIEKKERKQVFHQLYIKDFSHLQEVGKPALPTHIDLVAIPEGADYELIISRDVPLLKKGIKVYPALQPARDTEGAAEPSFEIDNEFYKTNSLFPAEPVMIKEIVVIRGLRYAMIQICPAQYNPSTDQLFLHENVNYEIRFKKADRFIDVSQHSQHALNILTNYALNGKSIKQESDNYFANNPQLLPSGNSKNYIIITHSNFLAAADSLAKWKRQMGYTVEIVSQGSWTSTQVKNAVHTRYSNWTPKPDYLVILGDHQFVPAEMFTTPGYNDPFGSDLYFVCMDGTGDYIPDMAKGRISANSSADALLQVSKMINYERNPVSDTSFYQNGLNCAQFQDDNNDGYADRRFAHTSEDIRDYTTGLGYSVQRIYYASSNVTPLHYNNGYYSNGQSIPSVLKKSNGYAWNGGSTDIKNSINAGKFYVFHRDHGYAGGYGWAHPYFVNSKITGLTNGAKLPVVFSINCHTGEFTLPSCFAETFMRRANGGAVGVVAASYYSYSGNNDGFSLGLVDAIWSSPGVIPAFGSGGNYNPNVTPHTDIVKMGDVLNQGLIRGVETWGGSSSSIRYTHELFHYFGDPAMRIWTQTPQTITATFSSTINCTDTALMITNCNDSSAMVTLMSNDILISRIVLQNGSGALPLAGLQGSSFTLSFTGRNMRPLFASINLGAGGSLSGFSSINSNICKGDSLGQVTIYPACGTPPYQILWSTGDTTMTIDSAIAGLYSFILSDATNTTIYDTISVSEPSQALQVLSTVNDAKCYFQSNGSIVLNIQGGANPYVCQWSTGSSSTNLINVSANSYSVDVTDSFGCVVHESFVVNQPDPLSLTTSTTNDLTGNCSGTATATVTGGITPYSYLWNDPNVQTTVTATGLCKGMYKVTVTDSNLCKTYRTLFIENTVGINESNSMVGISVYPNPSSDGVFNISIESSVINDFHLIVYNNLGKRVFEKSISVDGKYHETINLSTLAAGVYYLQIASDNQVIDQRNLIIK